MVKKSLIFCFASQLLFGSFAFAVEKHVAGASKPGEMKHEIKNGIKNGIKNSKNAHLPLPIPSGKVKGSKTPLPLPTPTAPPVPQKLKADSKVILREFLRAQRSEMSAIDHRNKFELKELKTSQDIRLKEWNRKEQEARHRYFAEHPKGSERRAYVADFRKRRDELFKQFASEKTHRTQDQDRLIKSIQKEHVEKLNLFKKAVEKGLQPSSELWPNAGR